MLVTHAVELLFLLLGIFEKIGRLFLLDYVRCLRYYSGRLAYLSDSDTWLLQQVVIDAKSRHDIPILRATTDFFLIVLGEHARLALLFR